MYKFTAWAIKLTNGRYVGRYWWFDGAPIAIPVQFEGCWICMFTTREIARQHLKSVNKNQVLGKVVKITVRITSLIDASVK